MADPMPPVNPSFKIAEVVHYGGEATVPNLSPEMQKYRDRAAKLREEKAKYSGVPGAPDAKIFLDSLRNKPPGGEKNLHN